MRNVCPCDVSHEQSRKLLFGTSWEPRDIKHVAYYYLWLRDYVSWSCSCLSALLSLLHESMQVTFYLYSGNSKVIT